MSMLVLEYVDFIRSRARVGSQSPTASAGIAEKSTRNTLEFYLRAIAEPRLARDAIDGLVPERQGLRESLMAIMACQRELLLELPAYTQDPKVISAIASELVERTMQLHLAACAHHLRGLAHDMRTPIGVVCGALNVIEHAESERLGPSAQRMIGLANANIDRLLAMLDDVERGAHEAGASLRPLAMLCGVDPASQQILRLWLEQADYEVLALPSGPQLLEHARSLRPGLIVMPHELVEAAEAAAHMAVPLVLLGSGPEELPGAATLPAPFKKADLLAAIDRASARPAPP